MATDDQELARDLGFLEAYTLGLGTMIGAGIFILPSIAAQNAGPASMISFAIGGVVSLLAALSLSELATGMPKAGGSYYFVNRALGSFFGSIVGWGMWAGLMFATAFYMIGFGQYLTFFHPDLPVAVAALLMSALLIAVNYRGVKETGSLQNVIVVLLVGLILVFLAFGVINVDVGTLEPFNPQGWGAVAATAGIVYVTFIGFEVIATSAEEIKNPSRNLPLSMIAAVVTPTILYVLVMFVSTGVLPIDVLAVSEIPVADVAEDYLGTIGALAMVIGAVLATVSSANASILSAARVNFAMGRDNILTDWLNQIHGRFRTPYRAILVTGGVILALIAVGVGIETLSEVASFTYLITYALIHVAVVVMRRSDPEGYEPTFRIPSVLYPAVPVVGFFACLAVITQMSPLVLLIGSGIVLIGVLWYVGYAKDRSTTESLVGEAIVAESETLPEGERPYRVVVPVANPETERGLLRLAAASAYTHDNAEIIAVNVIQVPRQTSLAQQADFEQERVERQQELLDQARGTSEDLGVGLRTRAIVGRNIGTAVLNVIEDENADEVLLGWTGSRDRREHILGSNIDPIVDRAPCEVTLVKQHDEKIGETVAFVGRGPHSRVAVRRAAEFVSSEEGATLTLVNAQRPSDETDGDEDDPETRGQELIESVVDEAGLETIDYETGVFVTEEIEETLLETAEEYDTTCVGATRSRAVERALFGSIPERIGEEASGTVAMVRGEESSPRSIREALIERLGG